MRRLFSTIKVFFYWSPHHQDLLSFPTRRSSDLRDRPARRPLRRRRRERQAHPPHPSQPRPAGEAGELAARQDRKSTRLNSSHQIISYAVLCLQKKITKMTY